ncbi:hypothetical protein ACSAZK_04465 [Methanosarcina sp. Mfa9]|uniref:hypothetical protein n=1 Tax=Methanosarcina sp. Mfa9 TaxID=3439063 RepID=UPI003F853316
MRDDMTNIYEECIKNLMENKLTKTSFNKRNSYWLGIVRRSEENSKKYDPHKKVNYKLDRYIGKLNFFDDFGSYCQHILTILLLIFGTSFIGSLGSCLSIILLVVFLILLILKYYLRILKTDTEIIQTMNNRLAYGNNESVNDRKSLLIAKIVWNRALCNYNSISGFIFLGVTKIVWNRFYSSLIMKLSYIVPPYIPEYVEKNRSKREFRKYIIRHYFKT